jgi:molybdate transport system substrate-binding protein
VLRRALLALVVLLGACSDAGSGGRITVFAASSLTEAFRALDVDADYSFGSSSRLARQVAEGAPADVLATADEESMGAAGDVRPVPFAVNRLVIAHRGAVREPADLARLRVVLAAPSVPAGRYAEQALDRLGITVQPLSLEPDVKAVAAKVRSGEADAGIAYATDARDLHAVDLHVPVRYYVAALDDGGRAFVDLLLSERGRRVLAEHGFGLP